MGLKSDQCGLTPEMPQINAIAPVTALNKPLGIPSSQVIAEAPVEAPRKTEDAAPVALAPNGISRVVMDARAEYDCGAKVDRTGAAKGRDFDCLAYVLEGFEHMRRMIQAGQAQPGRAAPAVPAMDAPLFADAGQTAPAAGAALDITL